MSDMFKYGHLNKELHNGSYVVRDKYQTTSGGAYELVVRRSDRYQSTGNSGIGGERGNSDGR